MAPEVLPTVSYSIGQALEVVDGSCIRGWASHTGVGNQISSRTEEQVLQHGEVQNKLIAFGVVP
jgi:hypothetical protein